MTEETMARIEKVSNDIPRYKALDLVGKLTDRGDVMKAVPMIVVDTMQEAADKIGRLERIVGEMWETFYGQNMQVANWHQNGELESMDTFFESNDWSAEKSA